MDLQAIKNRFGIIGNSSGLNHALNIAVQVANTDLSVLINGESGVGKEVFSKIGLFTPNDVRRMLDVEYISELTIALLNGIQNKKDKLENYYQLYEEDFSQEEDV